MLQHLYRAFWGLNSRLNSLLRSCQDLSLTFDENNDPLMMELYASQVVGLTIETSNICDFRQFPNLHSLLLYNRNPQHIIQITPEIIPNLTQISFLLESDFQVPPQLIRSIFSGQFPFLRYADLGRVSKWFIISYSTSPSLQFVSIRCNDIRTVRYILVSCLNLQHLQLHFKCNDHIDSLSDLPLNHPLQRFTLWSDFLTLTFDTVDALLSYTLNVQHLYLQTICPIPFIQLADGLVNRLHHLSRFDCFVKEMLNNGLTVGDLTTVHQLHPCFTRIRCIKEDDRVRIFASQ
jgi:hypothetical protein